ncbi:MAG: hypothetical protein SWN98_06910 [Pseudomonadota bacterium]|jgi:hypothetical protein|nr:hypothetical protein [Pseudomonadota bacterium]|tara:strand:- start:19 stop:234 length:216 start_codon:yes stop_codon:yes gene_type:complete
MHNDAPSERPDVATPLRALLGSGIAFTYFLVAAAVALWGLSFATWGVPGLYIPAVAAVPVMMVLLLWITRG